MGRGEAHYGGFKAFEGRDIDKQGVSDMESLEQCAGDLMHSKSLEETQGSWSLDAGPTRISIVWRSNSPVALSPDDKCVSKSADVSAVLPGARRHARIQLSMMRCSQGATRGGAGRPFQLVRASWATRQVKCT